MHEPTTDEKIQQLVRAVLEAVDSRLAAVRHELAEFASDMDQRHHQVLSSLSALEHRVDHLEHLDAERAGVAAGVRERMQALDARLTQLEHAPPKVAAATDDAHAAAADHTTDLSTLARPLYAPGHVTSQLPIVTDPAIQRLTAPPIPPTVAPTMSPTPMSAPRTTPTMPEPAPDAAMRSADTAGVDTAGVDTAGADTAGVDTASDDPTEDIDIERLKRILDERLSHLTLPRQPEV